MTTTILPPAGEIGMAGDELIGQRLDLRRAIQVVARTLLDLLAA